MTHKRNLGPANEEKTRRARERATGAYAELVIELRRKRDREYRRRRLAEETPEEKLARCQKELDAAKRRRARTKMVREIFERSGS